VSSAFAATPESSKSNRLVAVTSVGWYSPLDETLAVTSAMASTAAVD
jgi:hypothetical protein